MDALTKPHKETAVTRHLQDIVNVIDSIFSVPHRDAQSDQHLKLVTDTVNNLGEELRTNIALHYKKKSHPTDNVFALLVFLLDLTQDPWFFNELSKHFDSLYSPSNFHEIFWNIGRRQFTKNDMSSLDINLLRKSFSKISNNIRGVVNKYVPRREPAHGVKRIAILSPQILEMRHSPTREAVNIACHLEEYHSCEAYIFNTNGMSYSNELEVYEPFCASHIPDLVGHKKSRVNYMEFKEKDVNIVGFPSSPMSTLKVLNIIEEMETLKIDAVISHGENLFVQDAVYGRYPSVFATTGGIIPFARSDSYWVPKHLFTSDIQQLADAYGRNDFMLETMLVTPEGISTAPADRSRFSIPDEAVIYLVVSTRLESELDSEFCATCERILSSKTDAYLLFAGTNDTDLRRFFSKGFVDSGRIINIGFQDDIASICAMSDVYLNPHRQGGGTSSQTAIINGLPVVTLDYGHISAVVPPERRKLSWEDYVEYAVKLGENQEFLANERELFTEHFNNNLKTKEQISKIFAKLNEINERKATVQ